MKTLKTTLIIALLSFTVESLKAQNGLIEAFAESYTLEQSRDYQSALERLIKVYSPESYEVNLRLGWLCYNAGKLDQSAGYYSKAIDLKPYAIEPKLGLALPVSAQGKWDELIAIYNKILDIDPQNTLTNYRLGLIYYNRAEFEKAQLYIEKVVNLYPFDYDSLLLYAWNNLKLQKVREAKVLFQKVLMYKPGDPSAIEGLSLVQ